MTYKQSKVNSFIYQCPTMHSFDKKLMEEELVQGLDHDEKIMTTHYRSYVDTSRPFRSVKEAVAIFGERFLVGDVYSPKSFALPEKEAPFFSPSPNWKVEKESKHSSEYGKVKNNRRLSASDTIKKLEAELEETKAELKLLKERESESDMALATINAELRENKSEMAHIDAVKVAASLDDGAMVIWEEEKKRDEYISNSTSLAEILSMGDFIVGRKREKKVMKKKPIIPLIGDLFSRKKSSSTTTLHNYTSPLQWN